MILIENYNYNIIINNIEVVLSNTTKKQHNKIISYQLLIIIDSNFGLTIILGKMIGNP